MAEIPVQELKAERLQVPEDLVEVGHISGAYGIRGWVRIRPYSADAEALLTVRQWWLDKPAYHEVRVVEARWQGDEVVARFDGMADRNAAEALRGAVVRISRSAFPVLEENEYYWVDLIGLDAINKRGIHLGTVSNLIDNGAHPILQIQADLPDGRKKELLVPFVDRYVGEVDTDKRTIAVDWELDY